MSSGFLLIFYPHSLSKISKVSLIRLMDILPPSTILIFGPQSQTSLDLLIGLACSNPSFQVLLEGNSFMDANDLGPQSKIIDFMLDPTLSLLLKSQRVIYFF